MKSIFNEDIKQELINRINKIDPDSAPLWGKMNASQMMRHTFVALQMAVGEMKLSRRFLGYIFGPLARKQLTSDKQWRKNLPTAKEFIISDQLDFLKEKNTLIEMIQKVAHNGKNGLNAIQHPFFGKLSKEQWEALIYKHLDHHLRQFGV